MKKTACLFILFSIVCFSCKKEKTSKRHPELAGRWVERNGTKNYKVLEISDDSGGTYYYDYASEGDSSFRKFRIKANCLYYGFGTNLGEITQYPTVTPINMPLGFGNSDTIKAGTKYMILNRTYYTSSN